MTSEPPGSLFFFCFIIECQLVLLWMTCALVLGVVWINGCFFQPSIQKEFYASGSAARRCSEQRLNLAVLMQQSPFFRRRLLTEVQTLERSRGTGQLRNLCKDAISNPTHTCEHRSFRVAPSGASGCNLISSYLVDPASSHMLVLKIKPCMSKYKHLYRETANGSLKQLWFI